MRWLLAWAVVLGLAAAIGGGRWAAAATTAGQWITNCSFSHMAPDDPIVHPGMPGMSHMHSFFGNRSTNAYTTVASLMAAGRSRCHDQREHSAYWMPTAYLADGTPLTSTKVVAYWSQNGDPAKVTTEPVPQGMQVVVGDAHATGPTAHVTWQCNPTGSAVPRSPRLDHAFDCTPWGTSAAMFFELPSCWDANDVTQDHFSYPPCRSPFSHHIAKVTVRFNLGVLDPTTVTLSSGSLWTAHMDFFNAWEPGRQEDLVAKCITAHVNCGNATNAKP